LLGGVGHLVAGAADLAADRQPRYHLRCFGEVGTNLPVKHCPLAPLGRAFLVARIRAAARGAARPRQLQPGKPVKGVAATIVFEKKLDGRYYVVEHVRAGKRTLAVKTMYVALEKPEGAAAAKGSMAVPRNPSELNVRNTIAAADDVVAKSDVAAKPPKAAAVTPYVAVPKAGQRLAAFVRGWGGLKNEGQEVAALMRRTNGRPGLINNAKGIACVGQKQAQPRSRRPGTRRKPTERGQNCGAS
jgi:hypothetical protein